MWSMVPWPYIQVLPTKGCVVWCWRALFLAWGHFNCGGMPRGRGPSFWKVESELSVKGSFMPRLMAMLPYWVVCHLCFTFLSKFYEATHENFHHMFQLTPFCMYTFCQKFCQMHVVGLVYHSWKSYPLEGVGQEILTSRNLQHWGCIMWLKNKTP